jgi:hypothetical protein
VDAWTWLEAVLDPSNGLTASERLTALVVWRRWNRAPGRFAGSACWESRSNLAASANLSLRTVAGCLAALEAAGWLKGKHRQTGKDWHKREYYPGMPEAFAHAAVARAKAASATAGHATAAPADATVASVLVQRLHTELLTGNQKSKSRTDEIRPLRVRRQPEEISPGEAERRKAEQLAAIRTKGIDV